MIIGIAGTIGAGKGEKALSAFARGCLLFWKNSDNLNSVCKTPVPQGILKTKIIFNCI